MAVNANSIIQLVIHIKNGIIIKTCQCEWKNYHKCEKDYSWNPRTCIYENSKYLKSCIDTSVTECDEIVIVMDNLSTKKPNTIATKRANVTSTTKINCHSKKVRYCIFCIQFY